MPLSRLWAGRIYGTNTGNLFLELFGPDEALEGIVRLNDSVYGLAIYDVSGKFDGSGLSFSGKPRQLSGNTLLGNLEVSGRLKPDGNMFGRWETELGTAGTFEISPHDSVNPTERDDHSGPIRLYTVRHIFGPISLAKPDIVKIAKVLESFFGGSNAIVSVTSRTEETKFLRDFEASIHSSHPVSILSIRIQAPDVGGVNKTASVEFGQSINIATIQSSQEAWALGVMEKVREGVMPYEQSYSTNIKRLGFGVNQLLIIGAVVYLPSFESLLSRSLFASGVAAIVTIVHQLHQRFLPHASIQLLEKRQSRLTQIAGSWTLAFTSAVAATALGAVIQAYVSAPK